MRIEKLKNPGTYSGGQSLRARVAHAISFAEVVNRSHTGGAVSPTAQSIAHFLADAATKCPGYEVRTLLSDNQAVLENGGSVTVGTVQGTASVSGGMLTGVSLPNNTTTVTSGTSLSVDGGTVTLTVTGGSLSASFDSSSH